MRNFEGENLESTVELTEEEGIPCKTLNSEILHKEIYNT